MQERERERYLILFFLIIFLFNEVYFQVMQHVLNGPNRLLIWHLAPHVNEIDMLQLTLFSLTNIFFF